MTEPRFSKGSDEEALKAALQMLRSRWTLTSDGEAIERTFKFKTFAKAWVSPLRTAFQTERDSHQELVTAVCPSVLGPPLEHS
jgi:4a-hydroxytetrahydrobiopterin dehydratase